jgi:hypothetical protein
MDTANKVIIWAFVILVVFALLSGLELRFVRRIGFDVWAHLKARLKARKTTKFFFETLGVIAFVLFQSYALIYLFSQVSKKATVFTPTELVELLKIVVWPCVALAGIAAARPYLASLLSGSKVKLSLLGQAIETTLPELGRIIEAQTGGTLNANQSGYLEHLLHHGIKEYSAEMTEQEHDLLRPLRNYGLIMTNPPHATLKKATSIQLTSLGRLFMQARKSE